MSRRVLADDGGRVRFEPRAALFAPGGFFGGESLKSMRRMSSPPAPTGQIGGPVVAGIDARGSRSLRPHDRRAVRPAGPSTIRRARARRRCPRRRCSPACSSEIDEGHDSRRASSRFARDGRLGVWRHARRRRARIALRHLLVDEAGRRGRDVDPDGRGRDRRDASRRRDHPRVRDERQGRDHHRAGDAAHVRVSRARRSTRSTGTTASSGSRGSRAGGATGSRARATSTTPPRRTGCSRS